MKTRQTMTLTINLVVLLIANAAYCADLVCDPQSGVASYIVEIDGSETITDAQPDGSLKLNVDYLPEGQHTFRAKAISAGGLAKRLVGPLSGPQADNGQYPSCILKVLGDFVE